MIEWSFAQVSPVSDCNDFNLLTFVSPQSNRRQIHNISNHGHLLIAGLVLPRWCLPKHTSPVHWAINSPLFILCLTPHKPRHSCKATVRAHLVRPPVAAEATVAVPWGHPSVKWVHGTVQYMVIKVIHIPQNEWTSEKRSRKNPFWLYLVRVSDCFVCLFIDSLSLLESEDYLEQDGYLEEEEIITGEDVLSDNINQNRQQLKRRRVLRAPRERQRGKAVQCFLFC